MNLHALSNAISAKEACEGRKQQAISKVASERQTLAKMQQGNFTLRGAFMSGSKKNNEMARITQAVQQLDKDVKNWDVLKRFITIYLAEVAIPQFRKRKVVKYVEAMQLFS